MPFSFFFLVNCPLTPVDQIAVWFLCIPGASDVAAVTVCVFCLCFHEFVTRTYFFKDFIYLFLERGKEGEKHPCVVASHAPPPEDLACNPGMCPGLGIEPATLWFSGWCSIH